MIRSGSKAMDDSGIKLVRVREVEVEAAATPESFGAQGALVEAACGMEDECMVLKFAATGGRKDAMRAVNRWQEWRHSLVGNDDFCR